MQKLMEKLIEKHLLNEIQRITLNVYNESFNKVFQEICHSNCDDDTTLGKTFDKIKKMASIEVKNFMDDYLKEINVTRSMSKENPFMPVLFELWYEGEEYFYFDDYIEAIIGDEYYEKLEKLVKEGILNSDGDYILSKNGEK